LGAVSRGADIWIGFVNAAKGEKKLACPRISSAETAAVGGGATGARNRNGKRSGQRKALYPPPRGTGFPLTFRPVWGLGFEMKNVKTFRPTTFFGG